MSEEVNNNSDAQAPAALQLEPTFCKYCGKPINSQFAFFPDCGKLLTVKDEQQPARQHEDDYISCSFEF